MSICDIDRLVSRTRSFLCVYDEIGLLRYLRSTWPVTGLIKLLAHRDAAVVKVSATCLGSLGDPVATSALLASLPHEDAMVGTMAEHVLLVVSEERTEFDQLQAHLAATTPNSSCHLVPTTANWDDVDRMGAVLLPQKIIHDIVTYLSDHD